MMNIAMGFDSNFAPYAAVTIKSILLHNKNVKFYLMYDNLSKSHMKKIEKVINSGEDCSFKWVDMTGKFDHLSAGGWKSKAVYFPVALPSICSEDRILFLDADILVTGSLEQLYNQDLEGYYLAGTCDVGMISIYYNNEPVQSKTDGNLPAKEYYKNRFNFNDYKDFKTYVNGGIMLFNLAAFRRDDIEQKMYEIFDKIDFAYNEQDCYNYVCRNKIKVFSPQEAILLLTSQTVEVLPDEVKENYIDSYDESKNHLLVHMINKPWKRPEENIPYAGLFHNIKAQTPYRFHKSRQQIVRFKWNKKGKYLVLLGHRIFAF